MIQWQTYIQRPRQGILHKRRGNSPCQDKAAVKENNEVIVAVLSDGLGSLEYSGIAAEAITSAISTFLVNYDYSKVKENSLKTDILYECKNAINKCSDSLNISMSKMDCTLLFVVLFKNRGVFIFGQLGDGAICVVKQNQGIQAIAFDDGFKASSNLTKTVLSSDALDYFNLRICNASSLVGFFLTTDGLENELYSKAGKVKKKVEWYYNLISNNEKVICASEIENRWDTLTSDEKYGFTDDMSLIAIVQPHIRIELPEEANWLCACGHRNRMESSYCELCHKDFTKVYKGVNFKQAGGRLSFFTYYNDHPQEELRLLEEYCSFPLEFPTQTHEKSRADIQFGNLPVRELPLQTQYVLGQNQGPSTLITTNIEENTKKSGTYVDTVAQGQSSNVQTQYSTERSSQGQQYENTVETHDRNGRKRRGIGNINILACLLLGFLLGIIVHGVFDFTRTDNLKITTELRSLQRENVSLQSTNDFLNERIAILNTQISELEDTQNANITLPVGYEYYTFSNDDIYIGRLKQGLPNGIGVVYSTGVLMTGYFQNGLKNGEFYFLFDDGHSEVHTYNKDILIIETQIPTDVTSVP